MGLFRYRRLAIAQRLLALASVVAFLAATIGFPVVVPVASHKDRSQPYPCMNHACGCQSAAACWRSCCCFTNTEKLVWAAEHDVTPPQYVFDAAAREKFVSKTKSCCQAKAKSCCAKEDSHCEAEDFTIHGSSQTSDADQRQSASAQEAWTLDFVLAVQARRCQGQAELWLALGAVAPPPAKIEFQLTQNVCGDVETLASSISGISHTPASPPPRG